MVLASVQFNVEHTARHIASEFQKITDHWGITAIGTDNASNMVAAIRITGWTHIHCFAHTLNLVQEAIKADSSVTQIKKKCKDMYSDIFHHSV